MTRSTQTAPLEEEPRLARRFGTQLDRLWRLTRDCGRLLAGVVHTLRWLLWSDAARPGIGVLVGDDLARIGGRSAYLVRVYNPGSGPRSVHMSVRGWRGAPAKGDPSFQVAWDQILGPGESGVRWVVTTWQDSSVVVLDSMPAGESHLWAGGLEAYDRWMLEAALADIDGRPLDRLVIGGEFTR